MSGIGNDNRRPCAVLLELVVGANHHKTGVLAVCARRRLESELIHARYLAERLVEVVHHVECALAQVCIHKGMQVAK